MTVKKNNNEGLVTVFYKCDYKSLSFEILVTTENKPMKSFISNLI